ncbi:MAG TPA: glycoside hydrolase family 9 protein, partial [Pyrinomonadaceae bacterium]|nr:glycoside hydrolase family 9 protein [Pyrinomonadaceae bacterium]
MMPRLKLGSTVKLVLVLTTLTVLHGLGASNAKGETLPDMRGAVCLEQKNPVLKESLFPFDDAIRTNQVGMQPSQAKLVVFAGQLSGAPEFQIADEQGRSVFKGPLEHFGLDSDSGEELWRGNFTAFRLKGTYRVGISGRGFSHPFEIAGAINNKLVRLASRWLYLQRSGIDLSDPITGVTHRADHRTAAFLRDVGGIHLNHRIDTSGGWWDAGDYGRYVPPAASTIQLLTYAYHFNPQLFVDGTLQIPESGNGVPDLLDEMRWELEWLLKMQRSDGAVHQKTATRDYAE